MLWVTVSAGVLVLTCTDYNMVFSCRAYIYTQLGMSNLRKSTEQTCSLFFEDSGGDVAVTVDTGQVARANFVKGSKVVELSSPVHCNFFSLNLYIPPQTEIVLTLKRAPTECFNYS